MGLLINFSLLFCGVLALATGFFYVQVEKNDVLLKRSLVIMGFFAFLWCGGYAWMGFARDLSAAYLGRSAGLLGVLGFMVTEAIFVIQFSDTIKIPKFVPVTILLGTALLDAFLFLQPHVLTFTQVDGRTCYYANVSIGRRFHEIFVILLFLFMLFMAVNWYRQDHLKREKRIIFTMILANICIVLCALPDTLLPMFDKPSFPSSGYGAFIAYMVIWFVTSKYNAFNISVTNLSSYIYESVNSTVLVFDPSHKLVLINDFGRKFLQIDRIQGQRLCDLFEISELDSESLFQRMSKAQNGNDCRLVSLKGRAICALNFTTIEDSLKDPYCTICFVYDLSREAEMLKEVNSIKEELQNNLDEKTRQLERLTLQAITTIANTIDAKDKYTKGHSIRVAEYSALLAQAMGWKENDIQNLKYIALLHDIGKIGVPDTVLNKPGALTDLEFNLIKSHTVIGSEILKDIVMIRDVDAGAKYHHERYDGKGYPCGLSGADIPLVARIICVADSYDAMSSHRVYRKRLADDVIRQQLVNGRGTQFDPAVLDVFLKLLDQNALVLAPDQLQEKETLAEETSQLLEQIMTNLELEHQKSAEVDYLTGLLNRKAGERKIISAMQETMGCLAFIDLDNLKKINDTFGHLAGDHALKTVGDVLALHSHGAIIARIGGDEFLYYMQGVNEQEAQIIVEGIIHSFQSRRENDPALAVSSLSIGLCHCSPADVYAEVYQKADKALYFVKQNGKSGYYFYSNATFENNHMSAIDLNKLVSTIRTQGRYNGVLNVEYREFTKIYDFINNLVQRYDHKIQLLMITIDPVESASFFIEDQEEAMAYMEKAIQDSLRNVDVCTRFSSVQFLVILMNADKENIQLITNRIFQYFYKMYSSKNIVLSYDLADLEVSS